MQTTSKHGSVIDLCRYLPAPQEDFPAPAPFSRLHRVLEAVDRWVTSAAAVVMALCLSVCTLLFFTML